MLNTVMMNKRGLTSVEILFVDLPTLRPFGMLQITIIASFPPLGNP